MNTNPLQWLLLIISLPSTSATARIRIWRTLKGIGCASLRDGVYLLPYATERWAQFKEIVAETEREGGNAWLLNVPAQTEDESAYQHLFDRSDDWSQLQHIFAEARKVLNGMAPQDINRQIRKWRRDYEALRAIDYFPNEASAHGEAAWMDLLNIAELMLSPGEPQPALGTIQILDRHAYQNRIWATRRHLWVDRVASAWLIRRFIDQQAKFLWLESPADCPPDALGFDFDGASFTHIEDRVTFEVLLASFGLEQDAALMRLATMVHSLDVGNGFVPEAMGFEAMMTGARQRAPDDDQLLTEMSIVLDSFYTHFSNDKSPK